MISNLVISASILFAVVMFLDYFIYILRSAPKQSYFSKRMWFLGFLSGVAVLYYFLNGAQF